MAVVDAGCCATEPRAGHSASNYSRMLAWRLTAQCGAPFVLNHVHHGEHISYFLRLQWDSSSHEVFVILFAAKLVVSQELTYARITLFFSCRRFLLGNLNTDISETSRTSLSLDGIPLSSLPEPSTTPRRERSSSMSGKKSWQASLPRTLFSCCFSECCMMFVMLMCQGLGIFSTV